MDKASKLYMNADITIEAKVIQPRELKAQKEPRHNPSVILREKPMT